MPSQPNALGPVHYLCAGTLRAADPPPDVPPAQNSPAGVALAHAGIQRLPLGHLERYAHALAGGTLALSGLAVTLLGL